MADRGRGGKDCHTMYKAASAILLRQMSPQVQVSAGKPTSMHAEQAGLGGRAAPRPSYKAVRYPRAIKI